MGEICQGSLGIENRCSIPRDINQKIESESVEFAETTQLTVDDYKSGVLIIENLIDEGSIGRGEIRDIDPAIVESNIRIIVKGNG